MTYNIHQQVLGLSLHSNHIGGKTGSLKALQDEINKALPKLISRLGTWKVAWGPVVWKNATSTDNEGPDNVWYVAYNGADTYVVAIAGTATSSKYDWLQEDGAVDTVVDLLAWIKSGLDKPFESLKHVNDGDAAYISSGTALGLNALLNNAPQSTSLGGSTALLADFLGALPTTSKIIFTGHSLGGALSPALAVTLSNSRLTNVPKGNVFTYPSAGPSIGNARFVALFEEAFPATPNPLDYQSWNRNLVNTLDPVPLAWCTNKGLEPIQNLRQIPSLYDPGNDCKNALTFITDFMTRHSTESGVVYRPLPANSFTPPPGADGQPRWPVKNPMVVLPGLDFKDTNKPCWLKNARWEHVDEYEYLIDPEKGPSLMAIGGGTILGGEGKVVDEFGDHWPILRNIVNFANGTSVTGAIQEATLDDVVEATWGDDKPRNCQ